MDTCIRGILLATICLLQAARSEAVTVDLTQYAQQDGGATYDLRISAPSSFITFPDGSTNYYYGISIWERGISYQQLSERYFGKWTLEQQLVAGPQAKLLTLDFSPFTEIPIPTLVGLSNGDLVGTTLPISWAFPSGESMPGARVSFTPNSIWTKATFPDTSHAVLQFDLAGQSSQSATLQVAGSGNISRYLGPLTVPPGTYTPERLEGTFVTWSLPMALRVVPEPSSYALAMCGIATLLVVGRRRSAVRAGLERHWPSHETPENERDISRDMP